MQQPIHFFTAVYISLSLTFSVSAEEIHVPDDVPWIVGAITLAVDGDVIIVHPGTYHESLNMQGKAITLRCLDPNDPDIVASTIISTSSESFTILCQNDEGPDTIINGFVITHDSPSILGGGIHNAWASPTIVNCIITGNHAHPYYATGGLYNYESSPTIINCTISENANPYGGGGISNHHNSNPIISNCVIINNEGGGIRSSGSSNPILTSTRVCENSPGQIYGDYVDGGGNIVSEHCPPPAHIGACCIGEGCVDIEGSECNELGGTYFGDNEYCFNVTCPEPCPGDITGDGVVNVDDIFAILGLWGVCP